MFPVTVQKWDSELEELVSRLILSATNLGQMSPNPFFLEAVEIFLYQTNSYYTNSMEGNPSKLIDIENALKNKYSRNKTLRNFQLEHIAHIQVQKKMIKLLKANPKQNICSKEFLCWLHKEFYELLPDEMKFTLTQSDKKIAIQPGQLRSKPVQVGLHTPPQTQDEIEIYLTHFNETLNPDSLTLNDKVLALATSHHRFLWLHPFQDGNGRVARLFTTAYSYKIGLNSHLLWNVTRAFARNRSDYDTYLALADLPRRNDLDGRGPLSEEDLIKYCKFFLKACIDQVKYMKEVLNFSEIEKRFLGYLAYKLKSGFLSKKKAKIIERVFRQGKVERKEIKDICHVKTRQASQLIRQTLKSELCHSPSIYGPLYLKITSEMATFLFPDL
ncbi:MAG: Fic family protein [Deltaproteobacteria bacterium]|nr:Fic family protein [Deltaproteobacteria bacterium]